MLVWFQSQSNNAITLFAVSFTGKLVKLQNTNKVHECFVSILFQNLDNDFVDFLQQINSSIHFQNTELYYK
jgi:hypothetical protein